MGRTAEGKANQRKASAEYHRRLREAGFKKMQVWVAPASRVDLARLTTHHGSQQAAIIAALAIAAAALPPTTKS